MSLAYQMFLIDQEDRLHRLPIRKFEAMLADPETHLFPRFAGQRVRVANAFVELVNRIPTSVKRITYHVMTFDRGGRFDAARFHRQEFGKFEESMAPKLAWLRSDPEDEEIVVDAADRFAARGGTWVPSANLVAAIEVAALGRVKTPRL